VRRDSSAVCLRQQLTSPKFQSSCRQRVILWRCHTSSRLKRSSSASGTHLRFLQDREYLERVAKARQWQERTLHDLALDGYLGRDDDGHICFISATGCKSRWREPKRFTSESGKAGHWRENGERRFRFLSGKSWLWRGELIPGAQTVYLCEGETDVITLIDRGIEDDEETVGLNPEVRFTSAKGRTVAVGLQGAALNR